MNKAQGITNEESVLVTKGTQTSTPLRGGIMDSDAGTGADMEEENKQTPDHEIFSPNAYTPKPVEIAQEQYYLAQKKLDESKASFWKTLKGIAHAFAWLLGLLVAVLSVFWAYSLTSIAEPIGGVKADIQSIKEENKEIKIQIQKNEDRLNETIDKLLDRSIKK